MSSGSVGRSGWRVLAPEIVAPAYRWVPEHHSSSGGEAADLAESVGLELDAEQRLILDALLAERSDGRWVAFEAAVVMARQNGKTRGLQALVLADLFLFESSLIVWTAHLFDTAQEAFRDIVALIDGAEHLSRRVKHVHRARGDEGIELVDGRRLNFLARSKTGGRGLSGDRVILDEAFALSGSEMGSLLPTLSARPNPQVVYASSAGMIGSSVLRSVRDRGRLGGDPTLAYLEWCSEPGPCENDRCTHLFGVSGCVYDDRDRWLAANPTLGRRISYSHVEAERRALPSEEFARERLGWWEDPVGGGAGIPLEPWGRCADRAAVPTEPVALAVDAAPNSTSAAVVACGGPLHVVETGRGTSWVPAKIAELVAAKQVTAVGIDPASPAGALISELERPVDEGGAGLSVRSKSNPSGLLVLLDGREVVQACGQFLSAVADERLVHRDQAALNDAAAGAGRKQVGDSWKWSRRDSTVNIAPLVAATIARFLWSTTKPGAQPADFYML
jgi:hypothetical protein